MDLIERQDAIDAIKKCRNESDMPDMWYDGMSCALRCIYQLSSSQPKSYREGYQAGFKDAQPERKRGKWEMLQMPISPPVYKCSVCGSHALQSVTGCLMNRHYEANLTNYCPNCGADMREVDDERPD